MFFKILIISVILVAFVMLALGVKLLFNSKADLTAHSCPLEDNDTNSDDACSKCQVKDLVDCPEKKEN
nr:hypothetical protein [uncultured Carboxylicivirga sp.]